MLFLPKPLSMRTLPEALLREDVKGAHKAGRCAVGSYAIYLSSYLFDNRFYIPYAAIERVFKRVAMSKGGFSGRGVFAALSYLVVIYDGGKEKQVYFKREEDVDLFIAAMQEYDLDIKYISKSGEEQRRKERAEKTKKPKVVLSAEGEELARELEAFRLYLEEEPLLFAELSAAARRKRADDRSNPFYKWLALAITLLGAACSIFGIISLIRGGGEFPICFTVFGLALIFLFSGAAVLPTGRNNSIYIRKRYERALSKAEAYAEEYPRLMMPSLYAHPATVTLMKRAVEEGKALSATEALECTKAYLKATDSSVQVEKEEFDLIMQVKPIFLIEGYR